MNIKEILDCVDNSVMELECVKFEDIPDDLQEKFIQVHILLSHISTALEMKLEMGEVE